MTRKSTIPGAPPQAFDLADSVVDSSVLSVANVRKDSKNPEKHSNGIRNHIDYSFMFLSHFTSCPESCHPDFCQSSVLSALAVL